MHHDNSPCLHTSSSAFFTRKREIAKRERERFRCSLSYGEDRAIVIFPIIDLPRLKTLLLVIRVLRNSDNPHPNPPHSNRPHVLHGFALG